MLLILVEFQRNGKDFSPFSSPSRAARSHYHRYERSRAIRISQESEILVAGIQLRPVIMTEIKLGQSSWAIELTLN